MNWCSSRVLWLGAVVSLAGCVSSPTPESDATERAVSPLVLQKFSSAPAGWLVVTRDSGYGGRGCDTEVHVDGVFVMRLRAGDRFSLPVRVGSHLVEAWVLGICMGSHTSLNVLVSQQQAARLRVRYGDLPGAFALIPD